jgi:hypothetical protein
MTVRTTSKTVTFMHPFNLTGTDAVQPAGTYTVETDEELLQPSSLPAYRRIATLLRLERTTGRVLTQIVETNPVELAAALARDAQPDETVPARAHSDGVVPRKRAGGPTRSAIPQSSRKTGGPTSFTRLPAKAASPLPKYGRTKGAERSAPAAQGEPALPELADPLANARDRLARGLGHQPAVVGNRG